MDSDETEFMENIFDALCSSLNEPEIKKLFLDAEGIDLMVLMMKYVAARVLQNYLLMHIEGTKCKHGHGLSRYWITLCLDQQGQRVVRPLLKPLVSKHYSQLSWAR